MRLKRWNIVQFLKIIFSLYDLEILIYSIITSLSYNYCISIYIHTETKTGENVVSRLEAKQADTNQQFSPCHRSVERTKKKKKNPIHTNSKNSKIPQDKFS